MGKKVIMISCFNWYEMRLKPIRDYLIEKGYEVIVLIADYEHIQHIPVRSKNLECIYLSVPHYKKNLSGCRIYSHLVFGKKCKKIIEIEKPDLIYCQIPPNNIAKHCAHYKKKHKNVKVIFDIIDLWPESMPLNIFKKSIFYTIWQNMRDSSLKEANHVFTECDYYQKKLANVLDLKKSSTLHLYKKQTSEEHYLVESIINRKIKENNNIVRFAYLGSMNHIIDSEHICKVIQLFLQAGYNCELHAIGDGEKRNDFEKLAKITGCKTFFYGVIFDEIEKIKILTPCDYAFNMMKGTSVVGLTTKSIDYLSYGLPIINNIKGDTWQLVNERKIGINYDEILSTDLAAFLLQNGNLISNVRNCYFEMFTEDVFKKNIAVSVG